MALSKTERIKLIQNGAKALTGMDQTDAGLALDTFEIEEIGWFPTSWGNGEAYAYCVDRLKAAPDETLITLNAHLSDKSPSAVAAGSWLDGHIKVFLSHTATHRKLAGEIRAKLLGEGIDLFVAHDRIETNQEWINEIRVSLATCDVLVALFTEDFLQSKWCDQEVGTALGRGIEVIPVMCGAVPHGFVSPRQGFEAHPEDPHAATRIAAEICKLVRGEEPNSIPDTVAATVHKYAKSHSFDEARTNLQKVMKLKATDWTPELVKIAEEAGQENRQVADAWWYDELVPDALVGHLDEIGASRPRRSRTAPFAPSPASAGDIPF
ncbi:MAG TPA: toll/interleukin-1 receptor domain-containing protein [Solirubrobacterales bacterium]